jgi:hypothetical protein
MSERASYYASLPEYYQVEELRNLLLAKETTSEHIITFIKQHKLSVNIFLKGFRVNEWVPLLHICCHNAKYQDAVKFLIKNGADLHQLPDADADVCEPLLFSCDLLYFRYLHDSGCTVLKGDQSHNIKRKLRCADIKRLKIMLKLKLLTVTDILTAVDDPILYCIKSMKDYLVYAFNIRKGLYNLQEELVSTVDKFTFCVGHLIKLGAPVTVDAVDFCTEYYLYEILELFKITLKGKFKSSAVIYHEYKDSLMVAILRPLLNDARYEKTCFMLGVKPDNQLYEKIKI